MAIFSCLAVFLVGKKKRSKISLKDVADDKKRLDDIELHVKPSNLASSSVHNAVQDSHFTFPKPSTFLEKRTSDISKVQSSDSLARVEFAIGETAYEGGDEHDEIQSMKREFSDFDLQDKRELTSHGSNTDLNNFGFVNKVEIYDGINNEIALANGHVSDPGLKQSFVMGSPVLKRSCSNIETKRATDSFNSVNRSNSYINFQNLVAMGKEEISYEAYSSPLSVKTSCSADHVMLKKRSSCQVLPSRSRKIWWKLFLWSHRNLHRPGAPKQITPDFRDSKQKVGYSSDTHEPGRKHEKMKNKLVENQWVAFSLESSPRDRVNAWINSLGDCALSDEEYLDEKRVEGPASPLLLEIGESSGKNHYHTSQQAAEEVLWANNIIQSLNSFSSVAHISNMGLKVIPSIAAFGSLRSINLSGNFISHITPGSLPKNLHILDLSRNKISIIEGLRDLTKLRVLNLSYNRISRIGHGISNCTLIKELYLAGNKISDVEGLHRLLKLTVLDLSFNKITTSKALGQLVANYNSLSALNLIGNPIQSCIGDELIRKTVLSLLPRISYFNKQQIKQHRIREVPANTKTALGDAGWGAQRRPVRRLGQVTRSSLDNKKGGKWKGKHHHSSSASRK